MSGLIRRAFPFRLLVAYFVALSLWTAGIGVHDGLGEDVIEAIFVRGLCGAAFVLALIAAAALLMAISTRYTITDLRVVLQIGIAFPIALTLPLRKISAVDLRLYSNGSGDIPLALGKEKLAYLLLWPHTRPWRFAAPQPMLRTVPDAKHVANLLSDALRSAQELAS